MKKHIGEVRSHLKKIVIGLLLLGVITIVFGVIYGTGQHILRQSANDPQIQLAEDLGAQLDAGVSSIDVIPPGNVVVEKSLAPFVIIFDEQGRPLQSSATLAGQIPLPPQGVFTYTRKFGEERVTWEPQKNVRIAAIIRHFNGPTPGFLLTGRSLREVEERESFLSLATFIGWATSMILTLLAFLFIFWHSKESKTDKNSI